MLVTAVQLVIAALLAVLYASTPPGFSPDAPIEAVPLGLTLFLWCWHCCACILR
ncbi:hypothetical protein ACFS07_17360 [Undibacterium arcticum]